MKILVKRLKVKASDRINIIFIGDEHIGHRNTQEDKLKKHIEYIRYKPHTYWIGMGDKCEFITPRDVRWDAGGLAKWIRPEMISDLPRQQALRYIKLFKPIANKCLGLLEGNHEYSIKSRYDFDVHSYICEELGVPNLSYMAYIRLVFEKIRSKSRRKVDIWATHGTGYATTMSGKVNQLQKVISSFDADVYVIGHLHQKIPLKTVKLYLDDRGKLREKTIVSCAVPSFFTTYSEESSAYTERNMLPPSATGVVKLVITPFQSRYIEGKEERVVGLHVSI